jgi:hypothetical protein
VFPNRIRQLVQAALAGRLAQVAAIVLPRTSDPDYKSYLYLQELRRRGRIPSLPPVLLFDLLQSQGPGICAYDAARVRDLLARLAQISGRQVSADALRAQIAHANDARAAAGLLATLRGAVVRVAGSECLPLLGARWTASPERYVTLADEALRQLAGRTPLAGPRIMLTGMPVDSTALHVAIESLHATVVDEVSPFGANDGAGGVDAVADPYSALAEWYSAQVVSARSPAAMLMNRIERSLDNIDVVVILLPADDARFGWEVPRLRALLDARGIAHAIVRSDPESGLSTADLAGVRAALERATAAQQVRHG